MKLTRADRSLMAQWWFSVDRTLLSISLLLLSFGLVLSLAASPPIALKQGLDPFHYFARHTFWFALALAALIITSLLPPARIRRLSLILYVAGIALMIAVILAGEEVNGAKRWLRFLGFSIQPSEFVKPAFVVLSAWFFAQDALRPDMPAKILAYAVYLLFAVLLILQPDIGQTILITIVWGALYFLSGAALWRIGLLGSAAGISLIACYFYLPHVKSRIDRFVWGDEQGNFQADQALRAFIEGGWFGRGPGEGRVKAAIPDAHTDFTFAVIAEEFGLIACLILIAIFCFIIVRAFARALSAPDRFTCLAAAGLIMLIGLQAVINMAVNIGLLPAKGMTLPFLSYGGSSLLGLSIAMGMILGLTRQRP